MTRACFVVVATALMILPMGADATSPYGGHQGTPEQQRACRPDVLRHCRGINDDYAVDQCLRASMSGLKPACRRVFQGG
jgi:hypothetical protein